MPTMKTLAGAGVLLTVGALLGLLMAREPDPDPEHTNDEHGHAAEAELEETGPHGGRMLEDGAFALELVMIEQGAALRFHAYAHRDGASLAPENVSLRMTLTRLGSETRRVAFEPAEGFLRSVSGIEEPHSFDVAVEAEHAGEAHRWQYASYEDRTTITGAAASAAGIGTAVAGPAEIRDTVILYGTVRPNEERVYEVTARFGGIVREVRASVGDRVSEGETLAVAENNDSLQRYPIEAPADGVILSRAVNVSDAADDALFTLADLTEVWVDFAAFPHDRPRLAKGQSVHVINSDGEHAADTVLSYLVPVGSPASQSVLVRAVLPNPDGRWTPGLLVTGEVTVDRREVPLAVRTEALQMLRESPVVFARFGDIYEARPITVGARDEEYVEVQDGLAPGTEYVTANSYVIKADLLKSGAAHAH